MVSTAFATSSCGVWGAASGALLAVDDLGDRLWVGLTVVDEFAVSQPDTPRCNSSDICLVGRNNNGDPVSGERLEDVNQRLLAGGVDASGFPSAIASVKPWVQERL